MALSRGRVLSCPAPSGHDQVDRYSSGENFVELMLYDALLGASKVAREIESYSLRPGVRSFRDFQGNRPKKRLWPITTDRQASDFDWMVDRLAKMKPVFVPGKTSAYHWGTFGWIIAECVRRTD